jgi:cytochrome c oxidase subunit 3
MLFEAGRSDVATGGGAPPPLAAVPHGGGGRPVAFDPARFGMFAFMGTVSMLFIGFTSALMLRRTSGDWQPLRAPGVLWFGTLALALSSVALEVARRRAVPSRPLVLLVGLLGLGFVGGQFLAWRSLAAQGIYLATNPASSFFYMLTGIHLAHLAGGLVWLFSLVAAVALRPAERPGSRLGLFALYWHFLGALWLYLVVVLFVI